MAKKTGARRGRPPKKRKPPTEDLVNMLAEHDKVSTSELGAFLSLPARQVREELIELEKLGIVYRTGSRRGTRWHLG